MEGRCVTLKKAGSHSMMETMINQIEEQQNLMAEMVQELQEWTAAISLSRT